MSDGVNLAGSVWDCGDVFPHCRCVQSEHASVSSKADVVRTSCVVVFFFQEASPLISKLTLSSPFSVCLCPSFSFFFSCTLKSTWRYTDEALHLCLVVEIKISYHPVQLTVLTGRALKSIEKSLSVLMWWRGKCAARQTEILANNKQGQVSQSNIRGDLTEILAGF